jgi:hypothetical protein
VEEEEETWRERRREALRAKPTSSKRGEKELLHVSARAVTPPLPAFALAVGAAARHALGARLPPRVRLVRVPAV